MSLRDISADSIAVVATMPRDARWFRPDKDSGRFLRCTVRNRVFSERVIIDGNNLLHAMHEHAPIPRMGRETMVRVIDRWAVERKVEVILVFDGPSPPVGLVEQMSSRFVKVRFSAPVIADDVIADMIREASRPDLIRVISGDNAVRKEANRRRCRNDDSVAFIRELFSTSPTSNERSGNTIDGGPEKPQASADRTAEWLDWFGLDIPDRDDDVTDVIGDVD